MHVVYLPDVETVMGANHGPGHGRERGQKEQRQAGEHGLSG